MQVDGPGKRGHVWDREETQPLTLTVNGEQRTVRVDVVETLLHVLRSELKLFGAREGCGVGVCGTCTVLLDGKPISSCLMPALMARHGEITTIEGLEGPGAVLDPVQQAYVDCVAFQCSFCTPGFILATKALLAECPTASEDEARKYLAGNLCRCGSYVKIMDAVMEAKRRIQATDDNTAPRAT